MSNAEMVAAAFPILLGLCSSEHEALAIGLSDNRRPIFTSLQIIRQSFCYFLNILWPISLRSHHVFQSIAG